MVNSSQCCHREDEDLSKYFCQLHILCPLQLTTLKYEASLIAHLVKNSSAMRETWVQSLGWEDPLEKGKYSGLENSMDYTVHGAAKSQTQLSDFYFHSLIICTFFYLIEEMVGSQYSTEH